MTDMESDSNLLIDRDRPIVFLDMCGVIADIYPTWLNGPVRTLNDAQVIVSDRHIGDRVHKPTWDMLKAILDAYDVQVIMVSSWLKSYLPKDHPDVIWLSGFLGTDRIIGSLFTGGGEGRGSRVKEFVLSSKLENWLVIDDARDRMYLDTEFFNNRRIVSPFGRYGLGGMELEMIEYLLSNRSESDLYLDKLFKLESI